MAARGGKRPNAGRKVGALNKVKKELQELISDTVVKECLENMRKLANGGLKVEKTNKKGEEEIYITEPNYFANAYLLDQKFGKARQRTELSGADGEKLEIIINDFREEK